MDRYTDIEFHAAGGFADVYRARDTWTDRMVAIKQLRSATSENLPRFKREEDMLNIHRDNPHVVDIVDSYMGGPRPYIVLEFAELGSLQNYVAKRRPWQRVARWLWDVSWGLTEIHERGDLVRDIKPSNLLRFKRPDGSDLIKIADFGVSQRPDNPCGQMTTSVFGTKGYIDPVAQVTQKFTAASDIYSLGMTMRELLIGTKAGLWWMVAGPLELRSLIDSMMNPDVQKRPTARQVLEKVNSILQADVQLAVQQPAGLALAPGVQQPGTGLGLFVVGFAVLGLLALAAGE